MPTFTDNDFLIISQTSNQNQYYSSGVYSEFDGLDIQEWLKIAKSYSGNSNVDYWDTVKDSSVSGISSDDTYPDYDIKDDGGVIEFKD